MGVQGPVNIEKTSIFSFYSIKTVSHNFFHPFLSRSPFLKLFLLPFPPCSKTPPPTPPPPPSLPDPAGAVSRGTFDLKTNANCNHHNHPLPTTNPPSFGNHYFPVHNHPLATSFPLTPHHHSFSPTNHSSSVHRTIPRNHSVSLHNHSSSSTDLFLVSTQPFHLSLHTTIPSLYTNIPHPPHRIIPSLSTRNHSFSLHKHSSSPKQNHSFAISPYKLSSSPKQNNSFALRTQSLFFSSKIFLSPKHNQSFLRSSHTDIPFLYTNIPHPPNRIIPSLSTPNHSLSLHKHASSPKQDHSFSLHTQSFLFSTQIFLIPSTESFLRSPHTVIPSLYTNFPHPPNRIIPFSQQLFSIAASSFSNTTTRLYSMKNISNHNKTTL